MIDPIKLSSGRGQFHSDGGNNPKPLRSITLSDIERMMTKPQQCEKSQSEWVIFSDTLTRQQAKQRASNAQFYALWADLDSMECVILQALADQLSDELTDVYNLPKLLSYNTKSATSDNQKARLIIPVASPLSINDFIRCQTVFNNKLEALGVIPDRATQSPAQICYLPNKGAFYQSINSGSQHFDPITFWRNELAQLDEQEKQAEKDRQQRLEQSRVKAAKRVAGGTASPIQAFNDAYSIDDLLLGYGYMRTGKNRYLSPNSTSGVAGLEVKDGRYITAHQSDITAGLRQSGDAFDVFVYHEHNGNNLQALKAAGAMFTTSDGVSLTKANQRAYMEEQGQTATLSSFDNIISNAPIKAPITVDADGVITSTPNETDKPDFVDFGYNKHGEPTSVKETLANFKALLEFEGVKLRYKVIGREIEWRDAYGCKGDTADGDRLTKLISAAKNYSLPVTMITDYIQTVASENSFNPVLSFIERQPWDGQTDYIEQLLSTLTIAKGFDISLARGYLRKWLVSAVMLATAPRPQEAHGVLILQSDNHGAGKGRWFKRLVEAIDPDLLGTGGLDVRDKDCILRIGKKWIYELSEIEASMSRREIGELKAFITTDTDEVRAPYARAAQKLPRRTVFCGSANNKQFLSDPTGSRRFWVIPVEQVNYEHTVNVQQLWAQAFQLYKAGESWWLSHDEIQAVTDANNAHFQQLCPISEGLVGAFKWEMDRTNWINFMSAGDALAVLFGMDYRPTQKDLNTAAAYLRKRCGDSVTKRIKGAVKRGYIMPSIVSNFD